MAEHNGKFIAYYRVSTARQGASGLGLEAQRAAVLAYLNGGKWSLEAEFTEIETGTGRRALAKRPELAAAIAACKRHKATLVIAKLDRLARNLLFIAQMMEAKVDFVAVDNPTANRLTVHILGAVAEDEARRIAERTKAALAAAKARGTELGKHGRNVLAPRNRQAALEHAQKLAAIVRDLRAQPGMTVRRLADELNARQVPTARGKGWHLQTVHRLLKRIDGEAHV